MKKIALVVALISALLLIVPAQALVAAGPPQSEQAAAPRAATDRKKEDIRKLLELTGTKQLMASSMEGMMTSMRPVLENSLPAGNYRPQLVELFMAKFKAKVDFDRLTDMAADVYDKHFSHEEIKQLVAFYQTPVGQKLTAALPEITNEMRTRSESWGRELGEQAMRDVLAEHPDLAEAMQAAGARINVK